VAMVSDERDWSRSDFVTPHDDGAVPSTQRQAGADPGLCGDCIHARTIKSTRGSIFIKCQVSFTDPQFAKYPRLPVLACRGYAKDTAPG